MSEVINGGAEVKQECDHKSTDFGAPVNGWCKCQKCEKKLREKDVKKMAEEENVVASGTDRDGNDFKIHGQAVTEQPDLVMPKKQEEEKVEVTLSSGVKTTAPTCVIICEDCGAERIIKIQDKFQVKRCVACQKKVLSKKRYESRKRSKAKKREEAKAAEAQKTAE